MRLLVVALAAISVSQVAQSPGPHRESADSEGGGQVDASFRGAVVQLLLAGEIDGYLLKNQDKKKEVLDGLVEVLHTSELPTIREQAVRALSHHAGPAYGPAFAEALSGQREVQFHALGALHQLGWTIEVVDSGYAYRVQAPESPEWILGSSRFVGDRAWRGEHPHRYTAGVAEVSFSDVQIKKSGELLVTATVENVWDKPLSIDLCNWRLGLIHGITIWGSGKADYGITLRERSTYCVEGRCHAAKNDRFGFPPHEMQTLRPGESLLVSVGATKGEYVFETPSMLSTPISHPFGRITCLPSGRYLVESRLRVNPGAMHQVKNLLWIDVAGDCPQEG